MVKVSTIVGCALAFAVPGVASAASNEVVVVGVPDGGLAATSLMAKNFELAARRLSAPRPDAANDPARLINLGNAYAGLGRLASAREAYRSARFAPDTMLVLANSEEVSSRVVARRALKRLEASYAMR
ncbi:tetratricopeptide repeat protein [Sphingobium sp. JS3065]|jgi:Flp pilus assembly protein TadD|uniref:tetratricopeptide repeat protein n=1 Tax=Sphingobium sp. JS3065 TaxID=2970925 RepID=UPI0022651F4E|nr:tetratricopeptide repeat protein [Sphingobium sp. JS3065]UZW54525.1 tetratricopeptide repeat protein [Sphingobium sp. JS3065]